MCTLIHIYMCAHEKNTQVEHLAMTQTGSLMAVYYNSTAGDVQVGYLRGANLNFRGEQVARLLLLSLLSASPRWPLLPNQPVIFRRYLSILSVQATPSPCSIAVCVLYLTDTRCADLKGLNNYN